MKKIIVGFEGEGEDIELMAYGLSKEDHLEVRKEITEHAGVFNKIDPDTIHAKISLGDYSIILDLESKGWSFHE